MRNTQVPTAQQWARDNDRRADYRRSFAEAPRREILLDSFGDTDDIMHRIMDVVEHRPLERQVANFSRDFAGRSTSDQYAKLHQLWDFCRYEIKYQKDPRGKQFIKHPLVVYEDGHCDCKSLTVLQMAVMKALIKLGCQLRPVVRFASYDDDGRVGHVYPVVQLADGSEVILDSVYHRFDDQQPPTATIDKVPSWATKSNKAAVNGIGHLAKPLGWSPYLQL